MDGKNKKIIAVEIENEWDPDQNCEYLIDASDGTFLEVRAKTNIIDAVRVPDGVKRINSDFRAYYISENGKGEKKERKSTILRLILTGDVEYVAPEVFSMVNRVALDGVSPRFEMIDGALIEWMPDGSGTVRYCDNTIPADSRISVLGKGSVQFPFSTYLHRRRRFLDTIVVPDNIREIEGGAFDLNADTWAVEFPSGLKAILGIQDFGGARIIYHGTVKEWEDVEKEFEWACVKIAVDCTDGTVYECGLPYEACGCFEKVGNCVIDRNEDVLVAVDLREPGDIELPDCIRSIPFLDDNGLGGQDIVLGDGRKLVLPAGIEYVHRLAVKVTGPEYGIVVRQPNEKFCVINNFLIEKKENGHGVIRCGWFGSETTVDGWADVFGEYAARSRGISDLYIPENVKYVLPDSVHFSGEIRSINFPRSLYRMFKGWIGHLSVGRFVYAGTVREWKHVTREKHWAGPINEGKGKTVVCSDGEVPVEEYNPSGFCDEEE